MFSLIHHHMPSLTQVDKICRQTRESVRTFGNSDVPNSHGTCRQSRQKYRIIAIATQAMHETIPPGNLLVVQTCVVHLLSHYL